MKLVQLEQFKAIAESRNMTRAAEKLYISQPALSATLRMLESELDCRLFDRIGRNLILNENGFLLLTYTNEIFEKLDEIKNEFEKRNVSRKILINFHSISERYFALNLSYFLSNENHYNIKAKISSTEDIVPDLMNQNADLAITSYDDIIFNNLPENIETLFLIRESLYLSAPLNTFEGIFEISLHDLINEKFIRSIKTTSEFAIWLDNILKAEKINLHFVNEIDDQTMINIRYQTNYLYFTSSLHIASTPEYRLKRRLIKVKEPMATRNIYLLYLKTNEEKIKAFLDYYRSTFFEVFTDH